MKITLVGPTYPYKGGISHFTSILAKELRKTHDVQLVSWKRQYPGFLYPVEQKDTASKQQFKADAKFILDFYNPISWIRAALLVRRHRTDKLIMTWVTPYQSMVYITMTVIARLTSKTKITYLCHNSLPHESKFVDVFLSKIAFALCDEIIVHSEADTANVRRLAPSKTVTTIFHPSYDDFNTNGVVNTDQLKQGLELRKNVLLFFGYIRKYKGLGDLLKAMPEVLQQMPDTSLLVVGEFWEHDKADYEQKVRDLGIEPSVVFVDQYVPNEEVGNYFAVADIAVCPYVSATQSGVIQMAYAFETPVVATNVGGLKEVVDEGVSGFVVPPQDTTALADGIVQALKYDHFDVATTKAKFSWAEYVRKATA